MGYIDFVVQPPHQVRTGDTLYPPPVVKIGNASGDLWAYVALLTYSGEIVQDLISGTLIDSAQALPNFDISNYPRPSHGDCYVAFPNLEIRSEGSYRIRITIMCNSSVGTSSVEEVESRNINVEDRQPTDYGMSSEEEAYLEALREDGRDV